jgi:F0F1-type ATP synthase delta subunit
MIKTIQKSDNIISGIMDYLSETGEEHLLTEVSRELEVIVKKSKSAEEIEVNSVVKMSHAQTLFIRQYIQKILKLDLPVVCTIDAKLIGGFTIQVGDWFLDASLKYQIESIKQTLLE